MGPVGDFLDSERIRFFVPIFGGSYSWRLRKFREDVLV